jgi:membrane-bound lytic murein transglycosylase D
MKFRIKLLPLALSTLLAACASTPSNKPPSPAHVTDSAASNPPPAKPTEAPAAVPTSEPPSNDPSSVWDRLRDSFAMADCDADPAIEGWARRFTRNPRRLESQLQAVLPRLVYVQKVASRYGIPGEFALIPWVESHFQPVPGKRHRPAGMWQIMPVTAGAMGLRVDGHYDGRMDIPAAANAVMKLLSQYNDQFHDWRVADYAYNAGEFSIRRIIRKHGMPPALPIIPDWPVRKVTRNHLTKLLGMACVVRDPSRFHVTLPTLPEEQHLVKVDIPHSMPLTRAADHAGLSTDIFKKLNSAFRDGRLDSEAVSYLMLPASHAEQFKDAAQYAGDGTTAGRPVDGGAAQQVHTVRPGESLWGIARSYHVKIAELKRWNNLSKNTLRSGQRLKIDLGD